jgi:ribosome-associated heat shock protein Hsp15
MHRLPIDRLVQGAAFYADETMSYCKMLMEEPGNLYGNHAVVTHISTLLRHHSPVTEFLSIRLDIWLWAARFFKTRSLAKQAVETGKVEAGGQRAKPSRMVRVGDGLKISRGEEHFEIQVLALSEQRGPASVAQTLYAETEASRALREQARAQRAAERNGYRAPEHKPDKRARRLIQALGDLDAL